tara:strand:- start:63 stop:569 length:507 start_codon:yes stop_codon:yes gene_type:complete
MRAIVTLPGDIPGLLREGAPIAVRFTSPPCLIFGTVLRNGDIACRDGGHSDIYEIGDHQDADFTSSQLVLILSEPAGRDIAARWIAEKMKAGIGLTAPRINFTSACAKGVTWAWALFGADKLFLFTSQRDATLNQTSTYRFVPGLIMDSSKGPEAIRTIVLHLAGRVS